VFGKAGLADDPRFAANAGRVRHAGALREEIIGLFAPLSATEIGAALDAVGVPCAPINSVAEALADPQLRHRDMLRELPHGRRHVPSVVSPLRFADAALAFERGPPTLDQDREAILDAIGWRRAACEGQG